MGIDLARRAIHAPAWRWLPGMRTTDGFRVTSGPHRANILGTDYANVWLASENPTEEDRYDLRGEEIAGLPDLTDPATLGCLLALVREAHPNAYTVRYRTNDDTGPVMWWRVVVPVAERPFSPGEPLVVAEEEGDFTTWAAGATEAEALVAALEAAPVRR